MCHCSVPGTRECVVRYTVFDKRGFSSGFGFLFRRSGLTVIACHVYLYLSSLTSIHDSRMSTWTSSLRVICHCCVVRVHHGHTNIFSTAFISRGLRRQLIFPANKHNLDHMIQQLIKLSRRSVVDYVLLLVRRAS